MESDRCNGLKSGENEVAEERKFTSAATLESKIQQQQMRPSANRELNAYQVSVASGLPIYWTLGGDSLAVPHNQQFRTMAGARSVLNAASRVHRDCMRVISIGTAHYRDYAAVTMGNIDAQRFPFAASENKHDCKNQRRQAAFATFSHNEIVLSGNFSVISLLGILLVPATPPTSRHFAKHILTQIRPTTELCPSPQPTARPAFKVEESSRSHTQPR
jgi:hypothetical protein